MMCPSPNARTNSSSKVLSPGNCGSSLQSLATRMMYMFVVRFATRRAHLVIAAIAIWRAERDHPWEEVDDTGHRKHDPSRQTPRNKVYNWTPSTNLTMFGYTA